MASRTTLSLLASLSLACTPAAPAQTSNTPNTAPEPAPTAPTDACEPLPTAGMPCTAGMCPVNSDQYLKCSEDKWVLVTEFPDPDDY